MQALRPHSRTLSRAVDEHLSDLIGGPRPIHKKVRSQRSSDIDWSNTHAECSTIPLYRPEIHRSQNSKAFQWISQATN